MTATTMKRSEIKRRASEIAGAAWDDRSHAVRLMPLACQLLSVAETPPMGTDGDLTDEDRALLRALADLAPGT